MSTLSTEISSLAKVCCHYPLGLIPPKEGLTYHGDHFHNSRPILLVHGMVHNRSAFIPLRNYLTNQGFANVLAINYKTRHGSITKMVETLATKVDQILNLTRARQIDIIAHSLGGIVARAYMTQGYGRGKVRQLITMGTAHHGISASILLRFFQSGSLYRDLCRKSYFLENLNAQSLPRGSRITSIYSPQDQVARPISSCILKDPLVGEISNYRVDGAGHLSLLYSDRIFEYVYNHLRTEF